MIDQAQLPVVYNNVAVLQIAVGHAGRAQGADDSQPFGSEMQQHVPPVNHFANVKIQRRPFDPIHVEDRKSLPANHDAVGRIVEIREKGHGRGSHVILNREVTLIAIAQVTSETAYGVLTVTIHRLQFVNISKLAGGHDRHSQAVNRGHRISQCVR